MLRTFRAELFVVRIQKEHLLLMCFHKLWVPNFWSRRVQQRCTYKKYVQMVEQSLLWMKVLEALGCANSNNNVHKMICSPYNNVRITFAHSTIMFSLIMFYDIWMERYCSIPTTSSAAHQVKHLSVQILRALLLLLNRCTAWSVRAPLESSIIFALSPVLNKNDLPFLHNISWITIKFHNQILSCIFLYIYVYNHS